MVTNKQNNQIYSLKQCKAVHNLLGYQKTIRLTGKTTQCYLHKYGCFFKHGFHMGYKFAHNWIFRHKNKHRMSNIELFITYIKIEGYCIIYTAVILR